MENGKNFPPDTIPRAYEEKRETGPPPEAPVPTPLTEPQRRFAAQYHALIYGFLLEKKLEIREYDCVASRCRQIRTQKEYPAKTLREMCNSYGWGFCRGLSAAFQKQEAEHQEWGLVMVVPQAVEDVVSKMKRSSYKISPQSSMNHQYAAMGYADGQEFDMRRRLEPSA